MYVKLILWNGEKPNAKKKKKKKKLDIGQQPVKSTLAIGIWVMVEYVFVIIPINNTCNDITDFINSKNVHQFAFVLRYLLAAICVSLFRICFGQNDTFYRWLFQIGNRVGSWNLNSSDVIFYIVGNVPATKFDKPIIL